MRKIVLFVPLLFVVACGGSTPTAPSAPPAPPPPAQIAGNFSGTWESSNFTPRAVLFNINQTGTTISGTWVTSPDGWNGTITGTVDSSSFTGTVTYNARSTTGAACTGQGSFSGTVPSATNTTMRWTSPAITGNCTGMPLSNVLALQRR